MQIRRSEERGHANHGWLDSYHSFSFAGYFDPRHMGFRALRVINDDRIAGGGGFPTHPHQDMEIITYVVEGELEHKDSMGNGSIIRPGEVQRMRAGTGVTHSEYNHASDEELRLLQIWILPAERGLTPGYEQTYFGDERKGTLRLVASPDAADGSVQIQQDVTMYASLLGAGERVRHVFAKGRHGWLQVVRGAVTVEGERLQGGDGAAFSDTSEITISSENDSEFLLFDLA